MKKIKLKLSLFIGFALLLGLELSQEILNLIYRGDDKLMTSYNNFCIHIIQLCCIIVLCIIIMKYTSKILIINIALFVSIIMSVELLLGFFTPPNLLFKTKGSITKNYVQMDSVLGYKLKSNTTVSSLRLTLNNDTIYNVKYSTNFYSQRITSLKKDTATNYALFFGGSFTFGEGVNDNETLPYFFQQFSKKYKSYNMGFSGYGTQQMLANLTENNLKNSIKQEEGIAIYIFITDHIRRNSGAMSFYSHWGSNHPYYYTENNVLKRKGSFKTGRSRFINSMFNFLNRSSILDFFEIDIYPPSVNQYKLTAKIINESFSAYQKTYSNNNFIVLLYQNKKFNLIKPYLDSKIQILDYSDLVQEEKYKLHEVDKHPNKHGYKKVAKQLSIDIEYLKK